MSQLWRCPLPPSLVSMELIRPPDLSSSRRWQKQDVILCCDSQQQVKVLRVTTLLKRRRPCTDCVRVFVYVCGRCFIYRADGRNAFSGPPCPSGDGEPTKRVSNGDWNFPHSWWDEGQEGKAPGGAPLVEWLNGKSVPLQIKSGFPGRSQLTSRLILTHPGACVCVCVFSLQTDV